MSVLRNITELSGDELRGKRVLVRTGFDVPLENGKVASDFRLRAALPTLQYLTERGAKVVIISHLGREGETLAPVSEALSALLPKVAFVNALSGPAVDVAIAALADGGVLMLENLRTAEGEKANDPAFAALLAGYGDLYVNEAFSNSHRAHASMVGVPTLLPAYAGLGLIKEVEELSKALEPRKPALAIFGGAKFNTKLPLVSKFVTLYDHVFVGGALAHDIWRARGLSLGLSRVSDTVLADEPLAHDERIMLPEDIIAVAEDGITRVTTPDDVRAGEKVLDCGPKTVARLAAHARAAATVIWNGPLGYYEGGYGDGTGGVAEAVAESAAFSIAGGNNTIAAIEAHGVLEDFSFISTGGGAMLAFLEEGTLPALEVLKRT